MRRSNSAKRESLRSGLIGTHAQALAGEQPSLGSPQRSFVIAVMLSSDFGHRHSVSLAVSSACR
jgi:hypothetical protein